jgi:hypothetical protein
MRPAFGCGVRGALFLAQRRSGGDVHDVTEPASVIPGSNAWVLDGAADGG